ncbi:MAG: methanol/ethanol family PQQ-dependent dehydrogenase [Telluria sp.]
MKPRRQFLLAILWMTLAGIAGAAEDGQWTMPAHDYASTRFSALAEVTPANVGQLKLAFSFSTGSKHGHEAPPLVVGSTMYVIAPFPNILYALDLAKPGAPVKWKFDPQPDARARGVACCDLVNRGVAFSNGRIFMNTLDGQAIAVDAASGKEIWRTKLGDIGKGETITMAPLVVKDKVLVGNSGGELGVRGWLIALDAASGKIAWKAWSTGPDSDVLLGPDFKPFYDSDKGTDLGVKSWPSGAWKIGGGNVWGWISYDPEANLIYYGTGNPGPWNPEQRPGANKWTSGIFARNPDTGQARWFYQMSPHDLHDYDGVNENVLLDLAINGQPRKVLVHPDRNGYVYMIDRLTGEVLKADPFSHITTTEGVDLKTGALKYNPKKEPHAGQVVRDICPGSPGAKDWQPSAWSPRTQLLYIPHQNICQDADTYDVSYIMGTPYVGIDNKMFAGPGGNRGVFTAWDVAAGKPRWQIPERFPVWSGALVTAGDVAFYGTMDGYFKAVDAKTGKPLWQFKADSGIVAQPMSYKGPDGKQYIAVMSGVGGWAGSIVSGDLDARDGTAASGFVNVMKDLPHYTQKGGTLYVFALP